MSTLAVTEPDAEPAESTAILHSVAPDGRVQHLFSRIGPHWLCACGERRDRYGRTLP